MKFTVQVEAEITGECSDATLKDIANKLVGQGDFLKQFGGEAEAGILGMVEVKQDGQPKLIFHRKQN